MSNGAIPTGIERVEGGTSTEGKRSEPPPTPVGTVGIIVVCAYHIVLALLLLYGLIQLWPVPVPAGQSAPTTSSVYFLFWTNAITDEVRLLLIVALAGGLGGLVHGLRSLYWYIGHRALVLNWLVMYILLPYVGASLGVVLYLVIRGGFFSPRATVEQASPFGFAALAALTAMFSEQAVLKLKNVAEVLFTPAQPGADPIPKESAAPQPANKTDSVESLGLKDKLAEWRQKRKEARDDPNDYPAFRAHLISSSDPDPGPDELVGFRD